jgi:hypothetical protein
LFTPAHTAAMRDHTKRRNYSEEAEQFRREHAIRRDWGLEQRHARKLRRLYGSTTAAWAAFHDRVEELQSPARPAPTDGEAGPPARAGSDIVTETLSANPIPALPTPALPTPALPTPALPTPALPTPALPTPALPETAKPETARPGIALSVTALPETAPPVATTSAQVDYIPVVCDASASEMLTPEAILAETAPAEPVRSHPGRTNPVPDRPTPTAQAAQAEPNAAEPNAAEPNAAEPLSARRTARASTTLLRTARATTRHGAAHHDPPAHARPTQKPRLTQPANPGPTAPDNQTRAGENRPLRPAATCRTRPATNTQESTRKQSIPSNNSAARGNSWRRGELLRTWIPERLAEWYFRFEGAPTSADPCTGSRQGCTGMLGAKRCRAQACHPCLERGLATITSMARWGGALAGLARRSSPRGHVVTGRAGHDPSEMARRPGTTRRSRTAPSRRAGQPAVRPRREPLGTAPRARRPARSPARRSPGR